jgi:hypothetical protein
LAIKTPTEIGVKKNDIKMTIAQNPDHQFKAPIEIGTLKTRRKYFMSVNVSSDGFQFNTNPPTYCIHMKLIFIGLI